MNPHPIHVLIICVVAFIVIEALLMWYRTMKR